MKIIALSCTQKLTPSLTDECLQAAVLGFREVISGAEIERIRLIDHNIMLCQGEDTCLRNGGFCTLKDDFNSVVQRTEGAVGMILCTPTYGGNIPAVLKITQERLKSFMNHENRPFGNLNAVTIVHSRSMLTESAMGALSPWFMRLKIKNIASASFTQAGHGDIKETYALELCKLVGKQLAASFSPTTDPINPVLRPECTSG